VVVSNYYGGNLSVFPIGGDGALGEPSAFVQHPDLPGKEAPHAHAAEFDAAGRFVVVADLGLDRLFTYAYDAAAGTLAPKPRETVLAAGAGPRHVAFHPDKTHAYSINELDSTVSVFDYDAKTGALTATQSLTTLPAGFKGKNSTAEIALSADGRFLYASNRGHDSIAIFAVEPATGKLKALGHQPTRGKHPRHFVIEPTGRFLLAANRDSDNVAVFRIDAKTGLLSPVGEPYRVPRAVCLLPRRVAR
jgi:6-phosphogluconolactonase